MSHCPQCGATVRSGARACTQCGLVVSLVPGFEPAGMSGASKTIVGGVGFGPLRGELPPAPPISGAAAPGGAASSGTNTRREELDHTIVDPPRFDPIPPGTLPSADATGFGPTVSDGAGAGPTSRTLLGVEAPPPSESDLTRTAEMSPRRAAAMRAGAAAPPSSDAPPAGLAGAGRTLMGVATPGIAPLHPERAKDGGGREVVVGEEARAVPLLEELGATSVPVLPKKERGGPGAARVQLPGQAAQLRKALRTREKRQPLAERVSILGRKTRAAWLLGAAIAIVLVGVLAALLWPSAPPLALRIASREGVELLSFECRACPDGTVLRTAGVEATVRGGHAEAPSAAPLPIGDTELSVVVDRPGDGRDETVRATARVLYRVRLDLGTLAGKQPSISVVVEAVPGTRVTVDGVVVELTHGVGTRAVDVATELTGASIETTNLVRKIAYTVEPPQAPAESGVLTAQMAVVPLRIDAPGPNIVTDRTTFVLAGHTAPGAELTVAGHPIAVKPDGSFAHVMSVSSTGATQVEVRASQEGKAPRIGTVAVERVATLEEASRRFRERKPVDHAAIASDPGAAKGKPIILTGEIMEVRRAAYQTLAIVNVDDGCTASCLVRVVIGADAELKPGTRATFYGQVAGAFAPPSGNPLPEIDAAFFEVKPR